MRHTCMHANSEKNKRNLSSRIESALHREDVTAVVGFQASKKGNPVDEYEISVAINTG